MPKIITHHVYPPIPIRSFDWCAYFDGHEEAGGYGSGATEQEAIKDLSENCALPEPCSHCGGETIEECKFKCFGNGTGEWPCHGEQP